MNRSSTVVGQTIYAGEVSAVTASDQSRVTKRRSARPIARDAALDIVKGICVIVMVLYHAINYFPESALDLKYLSFVTGAFILLAGFVATNIYLEKYDSRKEWSFLCRRLGVRGIKLIVLAVVLNLLLALVPGATWKQAPQVNSILSDLLLGMNHRSVSFSLIVLIGYSLLLTAIMLAVGRGRTGFLVLIAIPCLVYGALSTHFDWPGSYYVRLLALGQVGAMLGLVPRTALMNLSSRLDLVLVIYFAQMLAMVLCPPSYPLYVVHLLCTMSAMYCVARKCEPASWVCRKLALLGKYSLLGYLFQIAFLQVLRRACYFTDQGVLIAFITTCLATLACAELVQILRARFRAIEKGYGAVFG
jgi:hypothetical protein